MLKKATTAATNNNPENTMKSGFLPTASEAMPVMKLPTA